MERLYIGEEYLALENKRVATLRYFVVEQSKSVEDNKEGISTYGLEVEKWNGKNVESGFVSDVTTDKEYAVDIMDCIRKNKVTPIHLKDIVVDML